MYEIPCYLAVDRDSIFTAVRAFVASMGIIPKPISPRSPWQNGHCERVLGSLRRELLDHVIVLDEPHLRRLLKDYVAYYHQDRTHLGLGKDSPRGKPMEPRPSSGVQVVAEPRCSGLHHRYRWDDRAT